MRTICQSWVKVRYLRRIHPNSNDGKIPRLKTSRGISGKRILRGERLAILVGGMELCFYKFMFINLRLKLDIQKNIFIYAFFC